MAPRAMYTSLDDACMHLDTHLERRLRVFYELCRAAKLPYANLEYEVDEAGVAVIWPERNVHCWVDPASWSVQGPGGFFFDSTALYPIMEHLKRLLRVVA